MNIWIITTGSSDVQLKTNNNWNALRSKVRNKLETQKQFGESKSKDGKRFLYPARAMGVVYGSAIENDPKHYEDLDFPLLNNFFCLLDRQEGRTEKIIIDRIIVIVTDQSESFKRAKRNDPSSPYWQDTCTLQPILEKYLKEKSSRKPEFLVLDPDPKKSSGLDNWNDVLEWVQEKFKEKFSDPKDILEDTTIYVSHQAGTPAISSAVQFASLARFGADVQFLVSNEQDVTLTDIVESSSYLRGIEIQQAKKLLQWHNYSGMKEVLQRQIDEANRPKDKPHVEDEKLKRVAYLLDIATHWNFAKFEKFAKQIVNYSNQNLAEQAKAYLQEPAQYWWWEAYEAAYLGVVRLKQGNTVEAMFHSFRAVEGLLKKWLYEKSGLRVEDGKAQLQKEVEYTNKKGEKKKTRSANAHGQGLYFALDSIKDINENQHTDIWTFGNAVFDRRNELFHQLAGLQDKDAVFAEWKSSDEQGWKDRVVNCLNFVADQKFGSIEEASLMAKVHKELEGEIDNL